MFVRHLTAVNYVKRLWEKTYSVKKKQHKRKNILLLLMMVCSRPKSVFSLFVTDVFVLQLLILKSDRGFDYLLCHAESVTGSGWSLSAMPAWHGGSNWDNCCKYSNNFCLKLWELFCCTVIWYIRGIELRRLPGYWRSRYADSIQ